MNSSIFWACKMTQDDPSDFKRPHGFCGFCYETLVRLTEVQTLDAISVPPRRRQVQWPSNIFGPHSKRPSNQLSSGFWPHTPILSSLLNLNSYSNSGMNCLPVLQHLTTTRLPNRQPPPPEDLTTGDCRSDHLAHQTPELQSSPSSASVPHRECATCKWCNNMEKPT